MSAFKVVSTSPFQLGANVTANTLNTAFGSLYGAAINAHDHDPSDPNGNYGNSIPAWGSANPLYAKSGPGANGTNWGTTFNGTAAIPADSSEIAINPANNQQLTQGSTGNFSASWGIHGEIARLRGAVALMKGSGKNWYDPVSVATLDGGGNLTLAATANLSGAQFVCISTGSGAAPISLPSTATGKVTYLNADQTDGYHATNLYGPTNNVGGYLLALDGNGLYPQGAIDYDPTEAQTFDTLASGSTTINNLNRLRSVLAAYSTALGLGGNWYNTPSTIVSAVQAQGSTPIGGTVQFAGGAGVVVSQTGNQILVSFTGSAPDTPGGTTYADLFADGVIDGLQVSAGTGLAANIGTGDAYVGHARQTLSNPINNVALTANTTNYVWWNGSSATATTTNVNPGGYVLCGTATTNGSAVTGTTNATPIKAQNLTGAKGGNVALANLITALARLGLVVDSTT